MSSAKSLSGVTWDHGIVESPIQLVSFLLESFVHFLKFLVFELKMLKLLDFLLLLDYLGCHSLEIALSPYEINLVHVVLDLIQVLWGVVICLDEFSSLLHDYLTDFLDIVSLSVRTLGVFLALSLLAEADDLVSFVHFILLQQRLAWRAFFSKLVSLKDIEQGFFLRLLDGFAVEGDVVDFADGVLVMVEWNLCLPRERALTKPFFEPR